MQCPKCGTQNDDTFKFCMRCGSALNAAPPQENFPPAPEPIAQPYPDTRATQPDQPAGNGYSQPPSEPPYQNGYPVPSQPPAYPGGYSQQPQPPQQGQSSYRQPPPQQPPAQPPYQPQPYQPPYQPPVQQPPAPPPQQQRPPQRPPMQMPGVSQSPNPNSGLGVEQNRQTWLIENKGDCVELLNKKVEEKYRALGLGHVRPSREWRGQAQPGLEPRPVVLFTNGPQILMLHITRTGKNLYVSLATYLKPQISMMRLLILGGMALFFIISCLVLPEMMLSSGFVMQMFGNPNAGKGWLTLLTCLLGPFMLANALALTSFVFYSLYRWVVDGDLLAGLRIPAAHLGQDGLAATEKAITAVVDSAIAELEAEGKPAPAAAPAEPEPAV